MSLFDGVKGKLGFGNKSDWQDDGYNDQGGQGYDDYQDDGYDDGYDDQEYLDGPIDDDYVDEPAGDVVSFDAYNPDKFENVKLGDRTPRVASYDSLGATSTSGRSYASTSGSGYASGATSNVRPLGPSTDRGYGASSSSAGSWRSSGDSGYGKQSTAERSRQIMDEISAQAAGAGIVMPASAGAQRDPYQSLGNDFIKMNGDPSTHLAIVRPTAYSDVEKDRQFREGRKVCRTRGARYQAGACQADLGFLVWRGVRAQPERGQGGRSCLRDLQGLRDALERRARVLGQRRRAEEVNKL